MAFINSQRSTHTRLDYFSNAPVPDHLQSDQCSRTGANAEGSTTGHSRRIPRVASGSHEYRIGAVWKTRTWRQDTAPISNWRLSHLLRTARTRRRGASDPEPEFA